MDNINQGHNSNNANCGYFWIANSILSTVLGANNRSIQEKAAERNEDFQREMQELKYRAQDEMEREKIAFKRRMLAESRKNRAVESAIAFNNQLKKMQLEAFFENYWPLAPQTSHLLMNKLRENKDTMSDLPLHVVMLHALLNENDYKDIEEELKDMEPYIGDISILKDYCKMKVSGNSVLMNLHYIMGQIPTLVISPKYVEKENMFYFNAAVWEAQATRPLIRPLFSFECDRSLMMKDEDYKKRIKQKILIASTIITGATRDSYALLISGKNPTLPALLENPKYKYLKEALLSEEYKDIRQFLFREYENSKIALDEKKVPNLLEAYHPVDVELMKSELEKCISLIK